METMSLLYLDLTDPASFQTFLRLLDPTGNTSADSDGAIDKLRFVLKQVKNEDGEILAEPLKESVLEQYYGKKNIKPATREIMRIANEKIEMIRQL